MIDNYVIYKHTSPSGKSYIGQTKDLVKRNSYHKCPLSGCVKFRAAILKYGWDNFTHEILEEGLTLEQSNDREEYWINYYNSINNGYNLRGGGLNRQHSPETKEKFKLRKIPCLAETKIKLQQSSPTARRISINGVEYPSITYAAKQLNVQYSVIWRGLKRGRIGYNYLD